MKNIGSSLKGAERGLETENNQVTDNVTPKHSSYRWRNELMIHHLAETPIATQICSRSPMKEDTVTNISQEDDGEAECTSRAVLEQRGLAARSRSLISGPWPYCRKHQSMPCGIWESPKCGNT